MSTFLPLSEPIYTRIYAVARQIPPGRVVTYGQIAAIVGGCTARMVGYAMAAAPAGGDVPWQRVINSQGKISPRADGLSSAEQQARLEDEGVHFNTQGRVDLRHFRWSGPEIGWLLEHGFDPEPSWREA